MNNSSPTWQSTVIALALIALVGGIFLVVFLENGIADALKAWGALGTLVGVLVGAIPAYFFGQQTAAAARSESKTAKEVADEERRKREEAEGEASEVTRRETEKREVAEARAKALLAAADEKTLKKARSLRGDLFE
jgi:hypothetical protein